MLIIIVIISILIIICGSLIAAVARKPNNIVGMNPPLDDSIRSSI